MKNLMYPLFVFNENDRIKTFEYLKSAFGKFGFDVLEVQSPEIGAKLVVSRIAFDHVNKESSIFTDVDGLDQYAMDLDMEFASMMIDGFEKENEGSKILTVSFFFGKDVSVKPYFS